MDLPIRPIFSLPPSTTLSPLWLYVLSSVELKQFLHNVKKAYTREHSPLGKVSLAGIQFYKYRLKGFTTYL